MTEVIVRKSIGVPASEVWEKLSSFRGIEEYSPIERSETKGNGAGATRTCYLPDGAAINEVLIMAEDSTMEMQYEITEGPFPITGYLSTIKVSDAGDDQCNVSWGCEFDSQPEVEADMIKTFEGFYTVIIESLEQLIKSEN